MAIGLAVMTSNRLKKKKKNGGSLELLEDWARDVLKSMNCTKRKGKTKQLEPSKQFVLKEKLTFQNKKSAVIFEYDISKELII